MTVVAGVMMAVVVPTVMVVPVMAVMPMVGLMDNGAAPDDDAGRGYGSDTAGCCGGDGKDG